MTKQSARGDAALPGGTVHALAADVQAMVQADPTLLAQWHDITPLARNEFICWITSAKKADTRARRITVAADKLRRGERRPCCWQGCPHRERTGR
jgi:uncharacterized protein YdeI (YjbR/CyaY-like superfamily)